MKVKKKKVIWEFLSQIWEKHLIFAFGIGAEIRPKNLPRKIPVYHFLDISYKMYEMECSTKIWKLNKFINAQKYEM